MNQRLAVAGVVSPLQEAAQAALVVSFTKLSKALAPAVAPAASPVQAPIGLAESTGARMTALDPGGSPIAPRWSASAG
jgi:hypothetical protein